MVSLLGKRQSETTSDDLELMTKATTVRYDDLQVLKEAKVDKDHDFFVPDADIADKDSKLTQKSAKPKSRKEQLGLTPTKLWKCPHCPATFQQFQQLGGHKSKAHPGFSQ